MSTDALLHAWHMSYDAILMDVETHLLISQLDTLLASLHRRVPALATAYPGNPGMDLMLQDVDLYLTVARRLLTENANPVFAGQSRKGANLWTASIVALVPTSESFFVIPTLSL